jgi:hypothetical protein
MQRVILHITVLALALLVPASFTLADVPQMINYQGRLTDESGNPLDTTVSITFTIHTDSIGMDSVWFETHLGVSVENGIFSVVLGKTNPIPDSVFEGSQCWLGIKVGTDPELVPRTRLVTAPYAYRVATVDSASGGTIDGNLKVTGYLEVGSQSIVLRGNPDQILATTGNLAIGKGIGPPWVFDPDIKLGIGTENPAAKLHVDGSIYTLGGSGDANLSGTVNISDLTRMMEYFNMGILLSEASFAEADLDGDGRVTLDDLTILRLLLLGYNKYEAWRAVHSSYGAWCSSDGEEMYFYVKDKVGIGTMAPTEKLDVDGNIHASGTITSGSSITIDGSNNQIRTTGTTLCLGREGPTPFEDINIGIGTTSPQYQLDVAGKVQMYSPVQPNGYIRFRPGVFPTGSATDIQLNEFRNHNFFSLSAYDTAYGNYIYTADPTAGLGQGLGIIGPDWGPFPRFVVNTDEMFLGYSRKPGDGTSAGGSNGVGNLYVYGKVGIGMTSPTEKLDVDETARLRNMPSGAGTAVVADANGVLTLATSSKRYKKNIATLEIDPKQSLELQPVRFEWKSTGEQDIGLIAEDVDQVIPELVIYNADGQPQAVKYDKVPLYLIETVKQQQRTIEQLKADLTELQQKKTAEIELLKAQMAQMQATIQTILAGQNGSTGGNGKLALNK